MRVFMPQIRKEYVSYSACHPLSAANGAARRPQQRADDAVKVSITAKCNALPARQLHSTELSRLLDRRAVRLLITSLFYIRTLHTEADLGGWGGTCPQEKIFLSR